MLRETLEKITRGRHIPREEARRTAKAILSGEVPDCAIAGLLVALKMKGESVEEIAGFADGMRDMQVSVSPQAEPLVDTCGTGGDGKGTFNISTIAAIIASASGVAVAKHGNRCVSSSCGSADVLEYLGVDISMEPERVKSCIEQVGIGFLFAPTFHPAMKRAAEARKALGVPTIFNILGPLTNPAGAGARVLGVSREELVPVIGEVLCELEIERAFVLHGRDGMDEFSLVAETTVCEVQRGNSSSYVIAPEDIGLSRCEPGELLGGDAERNASIFEEVLSGQRGPRFDISVANAAFAVLAGGMAESLNEGVRMAQQAVESGDAIRRLEMLVEFSKDGGNGNVP